MGLKNWVLLLFLINTVVVCGQNDADYQKKYWDYRNRFLNDFVRIGEERGESIPMAGRSPHLDCAVNYFMNSHACERQEGQGMLYWGDSTIELGNYMAVLAMMIRNLEDANQDSKAERRELYYAIKAFDRLDEQVERVMGYEPQLDGFFMRDDVPSGFFRKGNIKQFKRAGTEDGYSCLISHGSCKQNDIMDGSVASLDQIIGLLFGYTFVSEMIPNAEYEGRLLSDMVAEQTDRIVSHLIKHNWKITAPNGQSPSKSWGGNCVAFSYSIAETAERITKGKFRKKYQTPKSKMGGKIILGTFNWAFGVQHQRNLWMAFASIVSTGRWNAKKMARRTVKRQQEMYTLAYCAINNEAIPKGIERKKLQYILASAPGSGPCFGTPDCEEIKGWQGSDRWLHPESKNGNTYGIERDYNGLDYMLFYNLYHYTFKDELPPYQKPN